MVTLHGLKPEGGQDGSFDADRKYPASLGISVCLLQAIVDPRQFVLSRSIASVRSIVARSVSDKVLWDVVANIQDNLR